MRVGCLSTRWRRTRRSRRSLTTVEKSSQGPSCGVSYDVGDEYLLFVFDDGGVGHAWTSSSCHGPSTLAGVDTVREPSSGHVCPLAEGAPGSSRAGAA